MNQVLVREMKLLSMVHIQVIMGDIYNTTSKHFKIVRNIYMS
jgi:hypothetical protein